MEVLPYKEANTQYKAITSDPQHRMHGFSGEEFAKEAEDVLGDKRFNTLRGGAINRGLWGLGQLVDNIGQFDLNPWYRGEQSVGSGIGQVLQWGGSLFGYDSEEMQGNLMNVGREIPGGLLGFGILALGSAFLTPLIGIPLGAAFMYGDAYNDALEEGRSVGEAQGSGMINIGFGLTTGGVARGLGALGKNAVTRANQKLVAKQFAAAGISDKKDIARIGKKISGLENKWYKSRKSVKVTNWTKPGAPAITIRPKHLLKSTLKQEAIREGGLTAHGVTADILDTWMFNDQLNVGELLTDENYLVPMLAGDSITFIGGAAIVNTSKKAGLKRVKKREAIQRRFDEAKKKILSRKGIAPGDFDAWRKVTALEDMPDVELVRTKNINELGDVEYKWVDTAGMERNADGTLKDTESAPAIVSYETDEQGRIFNVKAGLESDEDLLFMALRRQFGIGTGDDGLKKFATFEYVAKEDGSDQAFIDNVLGKFAQVDDVAPGIKRVSDIHTRHDDSDARRRAAQHMDDWEKMPVSQEYYHFVERYMRAAQMGGIPTQTLRNEARKVFNFYTSKGLGDDMAMRLSLNLVERGGYKSFYQIYYGEVDKADTDLARVLRQDMYHSGRAGVTVDGRQWKGEHSDQAGIVFFHDQENRDTLKFVPRTEESSYGSEGGSIQVFKAGVMTREILIDSPLVRFDQKLLDVEVDILSRIPKDALTLDQQSALTLALGQRRDLSSPGLTYGSSLTDHERSFIRDLAEGIGEKGKEGFLDNNRIITVKNSDLRNPEALREMGVPILGMYANLSAANGIFFPLEKRIHAVGKPGDINYREGRPGIYMIVVNDFNGSQKRATSSMRETWIHEFGHLIHEDVLSRPEYDKLHAKLENEYNTVLAATKEKVIKWLKKNKAVGVPTNFLRDFSSHNIVMHGLQKRVGLNPETGELNPFTQADIKEVLQVESGNFAYFMGFEEWMAENFVKYSKRGGKGKTPPIRASVEKFFTELTGLWSRLASTVFGGNKEQAKLSPAYIELMEDLTQDFYTKLWRKRHPKIIEGMTQRYELTDKQQEFLGRKLWEGDYNTDFLQYLDNRLDIRKRRGNAANFETLVNNAFAAHKSRATLMLAPIAQKEKRIAKLNQVFFWIEDKIKYGGEIDPTLLKHLSPEERISLRNAEQLKKQQYAEILKTVDHALYGVYVVEQRPDLTLAEAKKLGYSPTLDKTGFNPGSVVDATYKAQSIVVRWLQGELEGQKRGLPREGGIGLLRHTLEKTMKMERKMIIESDSLKVSGAFEKKGQVLYYTDIGQATEVANRASDTWGNEGYSFEVRTRKLESGVKEFFIVRLVDELLTRVKFDEKYTQQNDGSLSSSTSEQMAGAHLSNMGHTPEVAGFHASRMVEVARAHPLIGQKMVWAVGERAKALLTEGLTQTRRVLDAFSGSGTLSDKVRREGFTGEVVENTLSPLHNQMKQDIRSDVDAFALRVEDHYQKIEDKSAKEAANYLKRQPESDTAALWLAQLYNARNKELGTVKDLSIKAARFAQKTAVPNALNELRAYAKTTTKVTSKDGWDVVKEAKAGDLVIVDPPYVGRNQYLGKDYHVTLDEQRTNLGHVWEADKRGAKIMYFDKDPSIKQDFITRGFHVETVKGAEFVAINYAKFSEFVASRPVEAGTTELKAKIDGGEKLTVAHVGATTMNLLRQTDDALRAMDLADDLGKAVGDRSWDFSQKLSESAVNITEGQDFLKGAGHGADVVVLHRIPDPRTAKALKLGILPKEISATSDDHSVANWKKAISVSGAKRVYIWGDPATGDMDAVWLSDIPGYRLVGNAEQQGAAGSGQYAVLEKVEGGVAPSRPLASRPVETKAETVVRMQQGIADSVKRGKDNELLPPELLDQIDGVLKELDEAGGQPQLDAIARDLGIEGVSDFGELQQLFMQRAFDDPAGTAVKISLLPNKTKDYLRGLLTFSIDLAESVEAQVRRANVDLENTGDSLSAIEDVKAGLALAAEEKGDIGAMSSVIARLQPGGIKEAEVEGSLWRAPFRWMEKVYSQTLMGLQHLAESHPLIRDAATALYQETGLQNKIYAESTDQWHARRPPVPGEPDTDVDYTTTDEDRSFKVVAESPELSDVYNRLRLLEQVRGKGFGELLAAKDKEVAEIFFTLSSQDQQKVADLIQRGHKSQAILTHYRNQVSQEIDRISAAKLLLRRGSGELSTQEAMGFIDQLDRNLMKGTDDAIERAAWELAQAAGIDLGVAENVTMFYGRLKTASAELHKFLVSRPYYVSERRMKRFHVSYIRKGDKTTSLSDFNTLIEAQDFASVIADGGGTVVRGRPIDTTVQASMKNSGARDMLEVLETATAKRKAMVEESFRDMDPDLADEVNTLFDELNLDVAVEREAQSPLSVLKADGGKARKFKGGRESFNMLEQQLEHSRRVAVALARKRTDAFIALTRQDKDAQSGPGSELLKLVEQAKMNQRTPDPAAGVFMSKFNFAMFLGMNVSSALIEMAQFPLTLTPILMELGAGHAESFTVPAKLLEQAGASMFSSRRKEIAGAGWTEKAHVELIRRAEKENRLNIRRYIDVDDDLVLNNETAYRVGRGEDMRGSLKTWNPFSMAYRLGAKMYAPFNRFNAELSLVSVYEVLSKRNPDWDFDTLYTQSVRWADIANGSAGKSNRPIGLSSGGTPAMRTLAQTSFGLMSFTNAAIGNWMRWIKKSQSELFSKDERKGSRKALAQAAGLHILGLGAMGLPIAGAINTIFAEVFGFDLEDTIKDVLTTEDESGGVNDYWANFALYGAMHAGGFAPDIQTRMALGGMAGLNPYKGWDALAVFGPSMSYAVSTVQALQQSPEQGLGRTITNLLPVGVRKAAQLTLTDRGQVRDRANRYITTPTEAEKASLILGFRPGRVRAEQSRALEISRAGKAETKQRKRAVSESMKYLQRGDLLSAQQHLQGAAVEQEGTSYSELYRGLEDRFLTEKFGKGFSTGAVTSSKISSPGLGRESRPSNEQVYRTRLGLRGAFGLPSRPSRRELRVNQRADQFMQTSPFLNPALAKKMARTENQRNPMNQPFSAQGFESFLRPKF